MATSCDIHVPTAVIFSYRLHKSSRIQIGDHAYKIHQVDGQSHTQSYKMYFKEMAYFQAISSKTRSQTFVSFSVGLGHVQGTFGGCGTGRLSLINADFLSLVITSQESPSCVNESERRKTYAHALIVSAHRIEVSVKSRTTRSTEISGKE